MGLAASQARLLLLTARKSDLEYRAQCITNTEMILAMQTESVAREYSNKISNTALFYTSANDATKKNIALNSKNFYTTLEGAYKLEILIGHDDKGNGIYDSYDPLTEKPQKFKANCDLYTHTIIDEAGNEKTILIPEKTYTYTDSNDEIQTSTAETTTYTKDQEIEIADQLKVVTMGGAGYFTSIYGESKNSYLDPIQLINMINAGTMRIVSTTEQNDDGTAKVVSLSGNTGFTEAYYTDDDAEAEAEYKRQTAAIQVKEKRLQADLQQVEAQQKACENEMDSVKKIMDKNIEKTFKVFS